MTFQRDHAKSDEPSEKRRQAIEDVRAKRAFWRQVSWFSVLNLAFWLTWLIDGIRNAWIAPWPLIPTLIWGAFILYQEWRLGGPRAISHETIDHEVADLRKPSGPIYRDLITKNPIKYGTSSAYQPIRSFHLQDVIDARENRAAQAAQDMAEQNEAEAQASIN